MQIAYLDGQRLRRALLAGIERLMERAAQLNAINVFPVPDGDTGTNMASTARTIAQSLRRAGPLGLGDSLRLIAESALAGARGNSGAILAQFFQGLAEELGEEMRVTAKRFARALRGASARTRAALGRPREGTIISLLDDWSVAAEREASASDDFLVVLHRAQEAAQASLRRTRELLPELKKAGVVDAGAQGFFHVLEGVLGYISQGRLRGSSAKDAEPEVEELLEAGPVFGPSEAEEAGAYRYCTEAFVRGEGMDLGALRSALASLGDSLVVAGSERRLRLHIHSNEPAAVFGLASTFGELEAMKVDDMELQRRAAARGRRRCAVLVDSTADLPDAERLELLVERVPVRIELGGRTWLDRESLGPEDFLRLLREHRGAHPTTSQPAPADFARKYDLLLGQAEEVVYVGLASVLSGTFEAGRRAAAERAALAGRAGAARSIDSRSISVGAALVARRAARAAAAGAGAEEVLAVAAAAADSCRLLVAVPDLSGLIRSGRLGGVKGLLLRGLGLRPLIGLDREGRAVAAGIYFGARRGLGALLSRLGRERPRGSALEVLVGHVGAEEEARRLAAALEEGWDTGGPVSVVSVCPALAAHAGPGAVVLAYLPRELPR